VFRGLHAEDDILENRKIMYQFEMLMYHADAQRVGIQRPGNLFFFSSDFNDARFEQHAHERRFPCAVFAEKGVNLTLFQLQSDVVVGDDAGKFLRNIQHLDNIIIHENPLAVQKRRCRKTPVFSCDWGIKRHLLSYVDSIILRS
jgi:hypothetical protein